MADQQLEDNKLPVREWLREHYIESEDKLFAICRHCSSEIPYRKKFIKLQYHLCYRHSEVLTEKQKRDRNVHWTWDYFTPKANKKAQCNMCNRLMDFKRLHNLEIHLYIHRPKYRIFNPRSNIGNVSSSASGGTIVKDAGRQKASIPIVSSLTDNTDRSIVPNESDRIKTEPTVHVMDIPENAEGIENVEKDHSAELELWDTEEVLGREKRFVKEELPEVEEL